MSQNKQKTDDPHFPLGFVKLDRRYLNWRWLPDENVCQVYLYLLLRANFQDKELYQYIIHKGELLTSYAVISEALKKSPQQIKRVIAKLKKTGEVDAKRLANGLLIKMLKYNDFNVLGGDELSQCDSGANYLRTTSELPAAINKKGKNAQNVYNEKETPSGLAKNWSVPRQGSGSKGPVPIGQLLGLSDNSPSIEQVEEFCQTMNYHKINPYQFHAYYSRKKWCDKYGNPIKDWKRSVDQWEMYGEEYAKNNEVC